MTQSETQELLVRLQSGDLDALGLLYDRYRLLVYRTALGITGDPEAASDLLQEVFLRVHRFAHRIDPLRPLEPWLYRVTVNLAYTWAKRQKRWLHPLENFMDRVAGRYGTDDDMSRRLEQDEEWRRVQKALKSIPVPQRVVVTLFYIDALSVQEIANVLDLPVGTVKSRLHYGRKALRQALGMEEDVVAKVQYEFT